MSTIQTNAIVDASGGNTTTVNGTTPLANTARFARNLIINGAMQVAQRATSATGIGTAVSYNTVDRWRFADGNNPPSRFTQTQSTDAPEGFGYSHKFEVTTADSSVGADELQYTDQFIEAQNLQVLKYGTSNAESLTLSFYVKCSVASTMGIRVAHQNSGGEYGESYTINLVNTWERKTITIPGNTVTAINNDNGRGLRIAFGFRVGSDFAGTDSTAWGNGNMFGAHTNTFVGTSGATWQVTGVQLEVGDTATDFEHRSYAEELSACQRYYYAFQIANDLIGKNSFLATAYSANTMYGVIDYPVQMRTTPSAINGGTWHARNGNNISFTMNADFQRSGRNNGIISQGSIGSSASGDAYWVESQGSTGYLSFDAEL